MADSKFKAVFTLKQHTPLIHFQSDQSGATLRATELKPKFDAFLMERAFENKKEQYERFISDKEKQALNYKVTIVNRAESKELLPNDSLFFVNSLIKNDREKRKAVITSSVEITFFSFHTELIEHIKKYLDLFLFETNFGTRQSKGFGSFFRSDITDVEFKEVISSVPNPLFILGDYREYEKAFNQIDTFYKKIKMGINRPYFKSLIFRYMCSKYHLGWEKKFIKEHFPSVIHGEHEPVVCKPPKDQEYRYTRAVLGLAEHNEFRPPNRKKIQVKIESMEGIARFKSPITFKVLKGKIYLVWNRSYENILNKEFKFSLNNKDNKIKTPSEFDMYDFLKFVEKETQMIHEVSA